MEKYNKYHETLNVDCSCNEPKPIKKSDCGCDGMSLPSHDNQVEIILMQVKEEVKKLLKTTEARLLCQSKKIDETMIYIKNNLSNAIRNLLNSMQNSGELDDIITDTVLGEIRLVQNDISNLDIKVETETTNRKNADSNLQDQINKLASGSPIPVDSISKMTNTDRVYVLTTTGHWYWYNGSSWVDGGVYQATGISDLSIGYQKIKEIPNGEFNPGNTTGYIASQYNEFYDLGTVVNSAGDNEYRRTQPIALTKGMILMAYLKAPNTILAVTKTDSEGNYVSTIDIGKDGTRLYKYKCNSEIEYVVLSSQTSDFSPEYYLYSDDYTFDSFEPKVNGTYNPGWSNGYVSYDASSYEEGVIVKLDETNHRKSNFIKLYKGNILKIKACTQRNICLLAIYDKNFDFIKTIYTGSQNEKYQDYNYISDRDCYAVVCDSINYVAAPLIEFYESSQTYVNSPVRWYDFFINQNGVNYVEGTYQTTNELLLHKGDVFDYYSISTTDNAYKVYASKNGEMIDGIIQNNLTNATDSLYYEKSYRGSYVAKEDCFVRLLNRVTIIPGNEVEIDIVPYESICRANIYNKVISAIGDSYLANDGENPGLTWCNRIASKYGAKYNNYGINGNGLVAGTNPVVDRLDSIASDSDFIIVVGGKNDYNNQISISDFKSGLRTLCSSLINANYDKKILFFTPFDSFGANDPSTIKLEEYANAMIEVCGAFCIPIYDLFHNSNTYMWYSNFRSKYCQASNDSSHLNSEGHKRLMNQCEKRIIEL